MYKRWEPRGNSFNARKLLRWLKKAKTWQLLIVLILLAFVAATFLRLNNIGMIEHRKAVLSADKQTDNQKTKNKLTELQNYVSSHMNASLGGGVVLENTYRRDYDAAIEAAANTHNDSSDVYQKAPIECSARFQGGVASFRNDYVTCVNNIISGLSPDQQKKANLPSRANYRYNFVSPLISLDFAGIFVILTIILTIFILLRWIMLYTLRFIIKRRAKVL